MILNSMQITEQLLLSHMQTRSFLLHRTGETKLIENIHLRNGFAGVEYLSERVRMVLRYDTVQDNYLRALKS